MSMLILFLFVGRSNVWRSIGKTQQYFVWIQLPDFFNNTNFEDHYNNTIKSA